MSRIGWRSPAPAARSSPRRPASACISPRAASRGWSTRFCDYALVYAFTDGLAVVDASVIEQVVTDRRIHGSLKLAG